MLTKTPPPTEWQIPATVTTLVAALKEESQDNPQVDLAAEEAISVKTVADFVTSASLRIFTAFDVFVDFLKKDPSEWKDDASLQSSPPLFI